MRVFYTQTLTHTSKNSKSSCKWGGDCRIALDLNVLRGQNGITNVPKKMFFFFVQKNKTIYYANCLIQFVLPHRLQMSNQSVICSITWIEPPKTWTRHPTVNLDIRRVPAWVTLIEKVSNENKRFLFQAENLFLAQLPFKPLWEWQLDSFTINNVFIAPIIIARKDSNIQTTLSQLHL